MVPNDILLTNGRTGARDHLHYVVERTIKEVLLFQKVLDHRRVDLCSFDQTVDARRLIRCVCIRSARGSKMNDLCELPKRSTRAILFFDDFHIRSRNRHHFPFVKLNCQHPGKGLRLDLLQLYR